MRRPAHVSKRRSSWWQTLTVAALTSAHIAGLWWLDRRNGAFARIAEEWASLIGLLPLVLLTYAIRYARWSWLLRRGHHSVPALRGCLAYLAGFALTATPGKAGELLRIRYFEMMGVAPSRTIGVFVFEHACDLLIILALSLLAASIFPAIGLLCWVVLVFTAALFVLASWHDALRCVDVCGQKLPGHATRSLAALFVRAALEVRTCLNRRSFVVSLAYGGLAWGLTSLAFVGVCSALGFQITATALWGVYPLAMLVGALSFIPGGVGTTELAIVLMLAPLGVPAPEALAAAIGARLMTLWFAIAVGTASLLVLEHLLRRDVASRVV